MKGQILIAFEHSGIIRDAFLKAGFDAWSCDLLPSESPIQGRHYQCDIRELLARDPFWLLMIAHPDCTYLTCSAEWAYKDGPYHQKVKPGTLVGAARRAAREEALKMFKFIDGQENIDFQATENPVGIVSTLYRPADQYIQPYDYGEDASKRTGLWLKNLPLLKPDPDNYAEPRYVCKCGQVYEPGYFNNRLKKACVVCVVNGKPADRLSPRWSNQTNSGQNRLSPGEDRWKERSKFYQGWADAMVQQWGPLLLNFHMKEYDNE